MITLAEVSAAVAVLFVPGSHPKRIGKAAAASPGMVVVDLEDAVAPREKALARTSVAQHLNHSHGAAVAVRINALSAGGVDDLKMLRAASPQRLLAVMVPKAENPDDLTRVADELCHDVPLVPLVETARGVRRAELLAAHSRTARLAFGALDLRLDLRSSHPSLLEHARREIVFASTEAPAPALDSPSTSFRDIEVIHAAAAHASALGFGGQLCIHPVQVPIVKRAFAPTDSERAWAERVTKSARAEAAEVEGHMVDRPVLEYASQILGRAHD